MARTRAACCPPALALTQACAPWTLSVAVFASVPLDSFRPVYPYISILSISDVPDVPDVPPGTYTFTSAASLPWRKNVSPNMMFGRDQFLLGALVYGCQAAVGTTYNFNAEVRVDSREPWSIL